MRVSTAAALAVLACTATLSRAQVAPEGPPLPFEDPGACPFEGCVYGEWIAKQPVVALSERQRGSRPAFTIFTGARVRALTGIVITLKAGRVQFRVTQELASTSGPLRVEPGQTLYLLTYQGEGFTKAWFGGRIYDGLDGSNFFNAACETEPGRCAGRVVEQPLREWWVQLRTAAGRVGWTDKPEHFTIPGAG